jgi:micrococcal nuclease
MKRILVTVAAALSVTVPALAMDLCGSGKRVTCVVDGDTFWWEGEKIRIKDLDAPEILEPRCSSERALGHRAKDMLLDELNSGDVEIDRDSQDRFGRTLATVTVDGLNVADTLISAGVARQYNGRQSWCD